MTEENVNVEEVETVGACVTAIDNYIATLEGLKVEAAKFDENKFEKKSHLTTCAKDIRQGIIGMKKSFGEFTKAITEAVNERKEVFDGTPEERAAKAEDRIKKMEESLAKAKAKLEADRAALG